jgi:hypothetical protein
MPLDNDNNTTSTGSTPPAPAGGEQSSTAAAAPATASATPSPGGSTPSGSGGETPSPAANGTPAKAEAPQPKSALEAVKKVMDTDRGAAAAAAAGDKTPAPAGEPQKGQEPKQQAGDENLLGKIDKAEWDGLPDRTRKRITQYRAALKERETRLAAAEPRAKAYSDLMSWVSGNKLSRDDFTLGLELMAAVRNDPQRAWQSLQPIVGYLREQIGEELPADIKARLDSGEISEKAAKELARERMGRTRADAALQEEREAAQQRAAAERAVRENQVVTGSIHSWEQSWKSNDPDYAKKWPRVWDRMLTIIQTERPRLTPKVAVQIAERAKREVEGWLSELKPPVREVRTVTGGASANVVPEPKSALEAARLAIGRRAAAG